MVETALIDWSRLQFALVSASADVLVVVFAIINLSFLVLPCVYQSNQLNFVL